MSPSISTHTVQSTHRKFKRTIHKKSRCFFTPDPHAVTAAVALAREEAFMHTCAEPDERTVTDERIEEDAEKTVHSYVELISFNDGLPPLRVAHRRIEYHEPEDASDATDEGEEDSAPVITTFADGETRREQTFTDIIPGDAYGPASIVTRRRIEIVADSDEE
ncbi:hypothetical protein OF83DRAFT_1172811 [Amylostereum chailletii]|nr:hypothetical protein OF83DRAFT_1172811 [Amylostereum chailletii]